MTDQVQKTMAKTEPDQEQAEPISLDEEEQRQFLDWLNRQDAVRRKHYLMLAKGYGLTLGDQNEEPENAE